MNKEQIYKELNEEWKLFSMTDEEIKKAYYTITGLPIAESQNIFDLKEYLLEFLLEQIIHDGDLDIAEAGKIEVELLEKWI